jgi:hypothetical protein
VFVQTNKFYFAIVYKFVSQGFSLLTFVVMLFVWEENKCKFAEETKMEEKETRGEETRTIRPDLPAPRADIVPCVWVAGCNFPTRRVRVRGEKMQTSAPIRPVPTPRSSCRPPHALQIIWCFK